MNLVFFCLGLGCKKEAEERKKMSSLTTTTNNGTIVCGNHYEETESRSIPRIVFFPEHDPTLACSLAIPDAGRILDVAYYENCNMVFALTTDFLIVIRTDDSKRQLKEICRKSILSILTAVDPQGNKPYLEEALLRDAESDSYVVNPLFLDQLRLITIPLSTIKVVGKDEIVKAACAIVSPLPIESVETGIRSSFAVQYQALHYFALDNTDHLSSLLIPQDLPVLRTCVFLPANVSHRKMSHGYATLRPGFEKSASFVDSQGVHVPTAGVFCVSVDQYRGRLQCKVLEFGSNSWTILPTARKSEKSDLAPSSLYLEQRIAFFGELFLVVQYNLSEHTFSFSIFSQERECLFVFPNRVHVSEVCGDLARIESASGDSSSLFPFARIDKGIVKVPDLSTSSFVSATIQLSLLTLLSSVRVGVNPVPSAKAQQVLLNENAADATTSAAEFYIAVPGDRRVYRFAYAFTMSSSGCTMTRMLICMKPIDPRSVLMHDLSLTLDIKRAEKILDTISVKPDERHLIQTIKQLIIGSKSTEISPSSVPAALSLSSSSSSSSSLSLSSSISECSKASCVKQFPLIEIMPCGDSVFVLQIDNSGVALIHQDDMNKQLNVFCKKWSDIGLESFKPMQMSSISQ